MKNVRLMTGSVSISWHHHALAPTYQFIKDHFVYAPSQWETTLQCNIDSHWLGAYTTYPCIIHHLCLVYMLSVLPPEKQVCNLIPVHVNYIQLVPQKPQGSDQPGQPPTVYLGFNTILWNLTAPSRFFLQHVPLFGVTCHVHNTLLGGWIMDLIREINSLKPWSSLRHVIACYLFDDRPLPKPVLFYSQLDHYH